MNLEQRSPEAVDPTVLRRTFGAFPTGVTVVTVGGFAPHGMTANSFTAVSLDPPLALICVERSAVMHGSLSRAGEFAVSVLGQEQAAVARYFADRCRPLGAAQFTTVDCRPGAATGAPLIAGAVAHFECALWRTYDGGDHSIFIGRVLSLQCQDEPPLLFTNGKFAHLQHGKSSVT